MRAVLPIKTSPNDWSKMIRLPFGRIILTSDKGEATTDRFIFPTCLSVEHIRDGEVIASYDLGSGSITQAGVNLIAADWTNATATVKLINYHDSGTGTNSASTSDTSLQVSTGLARGIGVQSNVSGVYTTVGVTTYNGVFAITEWGLLTASVGGTLWDRRAFGATPISTQNSDQLRWNYSVTFVAGG